MELGKLQIRLAIFIVVVILLLSEETAPVNGTYCESLIRSFGYPCEDHNVTTEDGYILSIQRIPGGKSSSSAAEQSSMTPVLVQHGLVSDGSTWLVNSRNESLGFVLANAGFDVWIVNGRGTKYSRSHTYLNTNDKAYWSWSWDELAAYDLPACIEYVHGKTGNQMHYVGHSQGTLTLLAALSKGDDTTKKLRSAALLSPIAYLGHVSSILVKIMADIFLGEIFIWLGINEFNPMIPEVQELINRICGLPGVDCSNLIAGITGENCCIDQETLQTYTQFAPQPTSTKNMIHLAQMLRTGKFRKFDYGNPLANIEIYGRWTPPEYDTTAIPGDFPVYVAHGGKDFLSETKDVEHLLSLMANQHNGLLQRQLIDNYAHMDFVLGYNAGQVLYDPIVSFLNLH